MILLTCWCGDIADAVDDSIQRHLKYNGDDILGTQYKMSHNFESQHTVGKYYGLNTIRQGKVISLTKSFSSGVQLSVQYQTWYFERVTYQGNFTWNKQD